MRMFFDHHHFRLAIGFLLGSTGGIMSLCSLRARIACPCVSLVNASVILGLAIKKAMEISINRINGGSW